MSRNAVALILFVLVSALGAAPAGAADAVPDRSVVILPMLADEKEQMAVLAAARVWPEVAYQVARDPTIKVIEPKVMPREYFEEASAVEAAEEFGARYVFMAFVSGEYVYRYDCVLRDGRTGAVVWGQILFTDEYAIVAFSSEIGVAIRMALDQLAPAR